MYMIYPMQPPIHFILKTNFMYRLREWFFRIWYWYISKTDKDADVLFMNYGYAEHDSMIDLHPDMEKNRYSVQLYHHLGSSVDLKDKSIVEIGSGRGGGLAYINKAFSPATAIGIDLNQEAVKFCNLYHGTDTLEFKHGDAQNLSLQSNSCEVVINVESSHRYPKMELFLAEVKRILKPGGYFLFTDFRFDHEMEDLKKMLHLTDLRLVTEKLITRNVVLALDRDNARRQGLIKKMIPSFLHKVAYNFAGVPGSETHNRFATGKYEYITYIMQKRAE
jgi:ubiquinone/menaquinone biosynthesis C-methylase UbiE